MKFDKKYRLLIVILVLSLSALACGISVSSDPKVGFQPLPTKIKQSPTSNPIEPAVLQLQQPTKVVSPLIVTNEEQILIDLYKKVNPAVVSVVTYASQGGFMVAEGQGSGFLYDSNGNIITNSHVIHGAQQVEVVFADNRTEKATVLGEDLNSDLAVLHVDNFPDGIQPLALGTIDEVAVGQTAVALGNPFGLGGTLTRGIISAMGRTIPALTPFSIPQAIQTDAPINPGNSGGPLLNLAGEVIGVNAQIETGGTSRSNSGIGFAIPVSIVSIVVPALINDGEFQWSWLGVVGGSLNNYVMQAMDLPVDHGAYISEVVQGGPADLAGLRGSTNQVTVDDRVVEIGGDVIVGIDGVEIGSFEDILIYIALNTHPGQNVEVTIIRDGNPNTVTLTLQPRPKETVDFTTP
jgi:S1-C subfamily serine protease